MSTEYPFQISGIHAREWIAPVATLNAMGKLVKILDDEVKSKGKDKDDGDAEVLGSVDW